MHLPETIEPVMTAMPVKAVLFDLDDTLWSVVPVIIRAEQELFDWLEQHVPGVAASWTIDSMRARRMELMKQTPRYAIDLNGLRHAVLCEALLASGEDPGAAQHAMQVFIKARNAVTPFDDVLPVLERLRAGAQVRLGVLTNGTADLQAIGMAHYFDVVIAAHQFGRAKPDPAIFLAACRQLGLAPAQVVYVGDDPALDVEGAKNAGLQTVWMRRADLPSVRSMPEHIVPDAVCATLHELEAWLGQRIMVAAPLASRIDRSGPADRTN
ncbi:MAG: HAD family hydrolase [Janthinobacterium lividum]